MVLAESELRTSIDSTLRLVVQAVFVAAAVAIATTSDGSFMKSNFCKINQNLITDKCLVSDIQQKINRSRNWVEGKVEQYFSSVFAKIGFNLKIISQKVKKSIVITSVDITCLFKKL